MSVLRSSLFVLILSATAAALQWTMSTSTPVAPPPPPPVTSFWTGILDPSRAMDWTTAGVMGGIPKYPACTDTFTYGTDTPTTLANNVQPTGVKNWEGGHYYNVGDKIADSSGNVEIVITAGMSRPWHPLWPTVAGGIIWDASNFGSCCLGSVIQWTMTLGATPGLNGWAPYVNYKVGDQIVDSNGNTETAAKAHPASGAVGTAGTSAVRYMPGFPTTATGENELTCDASGDDVFNTHGSNPDPNNVVTCPGLVWQRKRGGTDTALINQALQACASKSVAVTLAPGDFYITYGISFNPTPPINATYNQNVAYDHTVLRGAGPKQTKLYAWNLGPCSTGTICVLGKAGTGAQGYGGPTGQGVSFGAGALWLGTDGQEGVYHQGSHMLMFAPWIACDQGNCANVTQKVPAVGDMIHLDQRSDAVGICPPAVPATPNKCTAPGAVENGTTVTITTTIDHGLQVGECVAVIMIGPTPGPASLNTSLAYNTTNPVNRYNCDVLSNPAMAFFKVTAVPTSNSFQYTANVTDLPVSGNGYVVHDLGSVFFASDMRGISSEQNAGGLSQSGRMCPKDVNGKTPGDHCEPGELGQRTQDEMAVITRVIPGGTENCPANDNCFDIDHGLAYPNWRTSQRPGAWFVQATPNYIGIEDLTFDNLNDGSGISIGGNTNGAIKFTNVMNSWVKNTRILYLPRSAVWIINSTHLSIVENYIYGSKCLQATAYGFELHSGSAHNLLVNNICQRVNGCYMNNFGTGNVEAYNFNISAPYRGYGLTADQSVPLRPMIGMNHQVMHWSLFEGNVTPGISADDIHGTSNGHAIFRNRLIGNDFPRKCLNPFVVQLSAFQRVHNFIGNVMSEPLDTPCAAQYYVGVNFRVSGEYAIGDSMSTSSKCCYWIDPNVPGTIMRWGNYDAFTAAQPNSGNGVRWCGDPNDPGWTTICSGIRSATYQGGNITVNTNNVALGTWCTVRFTSGGNGQARLNKRSQCCYNHYSVYAGCRNQNPNH